MSKFLFFVFFLLMQFPSLWPADVACADNLGQQPGNVKSGSIAPEPEYVSLPEPGKKVAIGSGYYLIYGFDKKPKLGIVIMKVEIFDRDGRKDTSFGVKAHADMPSMKGAHMTIDRAFKLSKRGDYLAPQDIVMPGEWEIKLTVSKEGKVFFRGKYKFEV
jgi:hypothetical protein